MGAPEHWDLHDIQGEQPGRGADSALPMGQEAHLDGLWSSCLPEDGSWVQQEVSGGSCVLFPLRCVQAQRTAIMGPLQECATWLIWR